MYSNTSYSNDLTRQKSVYLSDFNEILNVYGTLELAVLTAAEFRSLVTNPKSVIFDKIGDGQTPTINGIPISRDKAIELVTMPDGFDALNQLIEGFKNSHSRWNEFLNDIDIVDGVVVLKQSVIDANVEAGKTYATTPNEKALFDFLTAVKTAASTYFGETKADLGILVSKGIMLNTDPGASENYKIIAKSIKGFREQWF